MQEAVALANDQLECGHASFLEAFHSPGSARASHTFTVWSSLPEAIRLPSGENATQSTKLVCPLSVRTSCPVWASHTFTVWSPLPEAIRFPSSENATLFTPLA